MNTSYRTFGLVLVLAASLAILNPGGAAANEVVVLRSGNAPLGSADPLITMLVGSGGSPLSTSPFTTADFAAACSGPNATVCTPHPAWLPQLPCDPLAQWIGIDMSATPASALYCQPFEVQTCCIQRATLNYCWVTDDGLGDLLYGGPNPDGVYINGVAVTPSINGGNYAVETQSGTVDVTNLLHCGFNQFSVYNRDAGFAVSGVMYNATFDIIECDIPADNTTWGTVKALYR